MSYISLYGMLLLSTFAFTLGSYLVKWEMIDVQLMQWDEHLLVMSNPSRFKRLGIFPLMDLGFTHCTSRKLSYLKFTPSRKLGRVSLHSKDWQAISCHSHKYKNIIHDWLVIISYRTEPGCGYYQFFNRQVMIKIDVSTTDWGFRFRLKMW